MCLLKYLCHLTFDNLYQKILSNDFFRCISWLISAWIRVAKLSSSVECKFRLLSLFKQKGKIRKKGEGKKKKKLLK